MQETVKSASLIVLLRQRAQHETSWNELWQVEDQGGCLESKSSSSWLKELFGWNVSSRLQRLHAAALTTFHNIIHHHSLCQYYTYIQNMNIYIQNMYTNITFIKFYIIYHSLFLTLRICKYKHFCHPPIISKPRFTFQTLHAPFSAGRGRRSPCEAMKSMNWW